MWLGKMYRLMGSQFCCRSSSQSSSLYTTASCRQHLFVKMDQTRELSAAHDCLSDALKKLLLLKLPVDGRGRLKADLEGSPAGVEGFTTIVEEILPRTKAGYNFLLAVEKLKPRAHNIDILQSYTISDLERVWYVAERLGVFFLEVPLRKIIERGFISSDYQVVPFPCAKRALGLEKEHPIVKGYTFSKPEGIVRPSDIQDGDEEKIDVLFERIYGMVAYILRERSKGPNE